jgi:hypothetical protein
VRVILPCGRWPWTDPDREPFDHDDLA